MLKIITIAALAATAFVSTAQAEDSEATQIMQIYGAAHVYCDVEITRKDVEILRTLASLDAGRALSAEEAGTYVGLIAVRYRNDLVEHGVSQEKMCEIIRKNMK